MVSLLNRWLPVLVGLILSPAGLGAQQLTPIWSLDEGAAEEIGLAGVSAGTLLPDGRVAVLDSFRQSIVLIDPESESWSSIGSPGFGPHHFARASFVSLIDDGVIGVFDHGQQLLHLFETDGQPLVAVRPPATEAGSVSAALKTRDGGWVLEVPGRRQRERATGKRVLLLSPSSEIRTLAEFPSGRAFWRHPTRELPWGPGAVDLGFGGAWAPSGDSLIVVADGSTGEVEALRFDSTQWDSDWGTTIPVDPRTVSEDDLRRIEALTREGDRRGIIPRRVHWDAPTIVPDITRVLIDPSGYVWLRRSFSLEEGYHPVWTVIRLSDMATVDVEIDPYTEILAVGGSMVLAVGENAVGVPIPRILRFTFDD